MATDQPTMTIDFAPAAVAALGITTIAKIITGERAYQLSCGVRDPATIKHRIEAAIAEAHAVIAPVATPARPRLTLVK